MIGKVIANILSNDSTVTDIVSNRIFPILSFEETKIPLITYVVLEVFPQYDKTGWHWDDVDFEVKSVAKSYKDVNVLAQAVRNALELSIGTYASIAIERIYVIGISENYDQDGDSYILNMNFKVRVKSYS